MVLSYRFIKNDGSRLPVLDQKVSRLIRRGIREVVHHLSAIGNAVTSSLGIKIELPFDHFGLQASTVEGFNAAVRVLTMAGFKMTAKTEHNGRQIIMMCLAKHGQEMMVELAQPKPGTNYNGRSPVFVEHVAFALTDQPAFTRLYNAARSQKVKNFDVNGSQGFKPTGLSLTKFVEGDLLKLALSSLDFVEIRNDRLPRKAKQA